MRDQIPGQMLLLQFDNPCTCELDDIDPYCLTCSPINHLTPGDEVQLGSWYDFAGGRYGGRTALVNVVHDYRAETGDSHAIIFTCRLPEGGPDFPVAPSDMELW